MPLPNWGYGNKEKKEHQELKSQMAPEIVDAPSDEERDFGRKESRKKGRVTTGTIGIDLERKLVLHQEKDAAIWKSPEIDREEVEEIKKFASPAHQNLKREVRSALDSFISGNKVKQLQSAKDESQASSPLPRLSSNNTKNKSLSSSENSPFQGYGNKSREITKTGISIQPKGTYKLDSKKSLGSYNFENGDQNGDRNGDQNGTGSGSSGVTTRSSFSSYSMSSSSSYKY